MANPSPHLLLILSFKPEVVLFFLLVVVFVESLVLMLYDRSPVRCFLASSSSNLLSFLIGGSFLVSFGFVLLLPNPSYYPGGLLNGYQEPLPPGDFTIFISPEVLQFNFLIPVAFAYCFLASIAIETATIHILWRGCPRTTWRAVFHANVTSHVVVGLLAIFPMILMHDSGLLNRTLSPDSGWYLMRGNLALFGIVLLSLGIAIFLVFISFSRRLMPWLYRFIPLPRRRANLAVPAPSGAPPFCRPSRSDPIVLFMYAGKFR